MHFRGLDLNLLVALDALLTERNVTRAAERLCISQPGMSAALQKLRDHFSDPILERVGRKFELTARAREMTPTIKELLSTIDTLAKATPEFNPQESNRTFSIAMSAYCADVISARLASFLLQKAPSIVCHIDDLSSDSLSELDNGKHDFCVTVAQRAILDPAYAEGSLMEKHLFTDQFCVVASSGNSKFNKISGFQDFCDLPYVETVFSGHVTSIVEYAFRGQIRKPMTRITAPSFWNAMTLASQSDFVTIVPRRMLETYKQALKLQTKPFDLPIPHLHETLMWHMRADDDRGSIWFRNVLDEICGDLA